MLKGTNKSKKILGKRKRRKIYKIEESVAEY
jgi:hypothetical protein